MKNFAKMSFDNDEQFEEYYSDVEKDLKDFNQERASAGLSALGAIPGAKTKQVKEEPFSDEEIAALVDQLILNQKRRKEHGSRCWCL